MNVLSLFDGISCGQVALNKAGIKYENYFASEIDKHAIKITQKNYPNTIQLGDVEKINSNSLPKIDLLIGGSPCQGFSFAGKQLNFNDPRSKLFFEYVRLLKELKPKYFLLENVKMKKEFQDVISECLGVRPVLINSADFTPAERKRLYWTNIEIGCYEPKATKLKDVINNSNLSEFLIDITERFMRKTDGTTSFFKSRAAVRTLEQTHRCILTSGQSISNSGATNIQINDKIYCANSRLCEVFQGLPLDYTSGVLESKRMHALGNGWTVSVIAHIFKGIL